MKNDTFHAEITARLVDYKDAITRLEGDKHRDPEKFSLHHEEMLNRFREKKTLIEARLRELEQSDGESRTRLETEIRKYIADIDSDLRGSMTYAIF